jgi:four helix bundle protein
MNSNYRKESGSPKSTGGNVMFDHEKLDAYQLELRFIEWVTPLLEQALQSATGKPREVCDQLDRASLSALLNTAEGNGRRQGQGRAKFFDDARGSITECAGCLDALVAKKILTFERVQEGKAILLRIVSILCKLVERFDTEGKFREDAHEYGLGMDAKCGIVLQDANDSRTRTRTSR